MWLWWLNAFPERAIWCFGGDALVLTRDHRLYRPVLWFFIWSKSSVFFSAVPQIVNTWSRDLHLRWKSHCTTPAYCPASLYHHTWRCSSSSGKSPVDQQKIFPRLNKIKSFELLLESPFLFMQHKFDISERIPTHLWLWIHVFRKAQSFWLLHIKTINTFYTCKF